jgi:hypothetical protein
MNATNKTAVVYLVDCHGKDSTKLCPVRFFDEVRTLYPVTVRLDSTAIPVLCLFDELYCDDGVCVHFDITTLNAFRMARTDVDRNHQS